MKFTAFLATFFFFIAATATAQVTLGARAGFGLSASSFELNKGMNRQVGFSPVFGGIFHYNMDMRFSVGAEVNYYKFSETIKYDESLFPANSSRTRVAVDSKTEISYIQIPFTGRASIGEKKYRGFISLGPYIGFAAGGSWKEAPRVIYLESQSFDKLPLYPLIDSSYKFSDGKLRKFDIGGLISGGIEYKVGLTGLIFAEARVQLGFFDLYNLNSDEQRAFKAGSEYLLPSATWRAVNFSVGYLRTFKLPKFQFEQGNKRAGKQKRG